MAQFQAMTFNFAGDSSINYGLYIVEFGSHSGLTRDGAGSDINIISDSVPRRAEQHIYGVQQDRQQQFSLTVGSDTPKSRAEIDRILAWLIRPEPMALSVWQWDAEWYQYTGFFTSPQTVAVDNALFGLQLNFICTSPYAYTFPKRKEVRVNTPLRYMFVNDSGDSIGYLRPTIRYIPRNTTQHLSIINLSDSGREFRLNLTPATDGHEVITVDNDLQIFQSSMGDDFSRIRFNGFNQSWFKLLRGANDLFITGAGVLEFEYKLARRVGA